MVRKMALTLAAGAIAAASPAAAQTSPRPALRGVAPVMREFRDWLLVCDNTRVCRAQARMSTGSLMVRRDPGPRGNLVVILDGQEPTMGPSVPDLRSIAVAGSRPAGPWPWRLDRERQAAVLEGEPALRFLRAIADTNSITYRAGEDTLEIPLSGMKAALLAMDDAQGRVDTPTAFTRIGQRPLARVLPAIEAPVVNTRPAPSQAPLPAAFVARARQASARILAANECSSERADIDQAYPLTAGEAIVLLFCGQGNVSTSYVLVRANRGTRPQVRQIVLPPLPRRPEEAGFMERVYSDVEWDPATSSIFSSGHSCAGGCGESSRWVFDGRDFVLASHLVYEAGGAEALQIYRAEVRVRR